MKRRRGDPETPEQEPDYQDRKSPRGEGDSGTSTSEGEGPPENRGRGKSQVFFFVALLLAALLAVVSYSTEGTRSQDVQRNRYVVKQWLLEDRLDPTTFEFLEDTRTFRAKLRAPEGEYERVEIAFATDDEIEWFRTEAIEAYNAKRAGGDDQATGSGVAARPGYQPADWTVKQSSAVFWQVVIAALPWILFILIIYLVFFRQFRGGGPGGNILGFGKSRARVVNKETSKVTFADVAGIKEAKDEVQEIIEFLKDPKRFQRLGGRMPRGIMLVGSPGTGKTLLAKAIAGEADVPFFSICGSDFVEMFVGVGAARVRDLFKQARQNSPCIVFLDEVDAVGRRRGAGLGGGHDEREQTLNAILVEMDGFDSDAGIILIAATNRPDVLDPALLRPGRFDREIVIDLPDLQGREEILRVHTRKVTLGSSVDLHRIARGTPAFSGAELSALVNEAAIIAVMHDRDAVEEPDFEEARDKIRWGRQKRSRVATEEDKRITAFHEAGHAVVAHLLPEVEPLHKVTIIPRGMALGATMQLPERDRVHIQRKSLLGNLKMLFAGRISERMFCGDVSAGASNDIERATEIVRRMVCEWGMSDAVGPINYSESQETLFLGREVTRSRNHSESIALRIDEEVRRIVDECYSETERLLEANREAVTRVAEELIVRETLSGDDVARLVGGEALGAHVPGGATEST